jgi:hypothetical protein
VLAHYDLVDGQRDQRSAGHGVMRHEDRDLRLVAADRADDLRRREDEPPGVWRTMSKGISLSVIWMARSTSSESFTSM